MGVGEIPVHTEEVGWNNTWSIQADTGSLCQNRNATGRHLFTLAQGEKLTIQYDVSSRVLSFGKNSGEVEKAFDNVFVPGKELSPFIEFLDTEPRKVSFSNGCLLQRLALELKLQFLSGYIHNFDCIIL